MSEFGNEFAPATVMPGQGSVRPVQYGDDAAFIVEFYTRMVEDEKLTALRGRRIERPEEYCKKQAVGDPRTTWDAPVSEADRQRWPQAYAAFQRGEHDSVIGTPLDAWPLLTIDMRAALKNLGLKTVEQIVEMTDGTMSTLPGNAGSLIQRVKAHAEKFLKDQEAGEQERVLAEKLAKRDAEVASLQNQMASLAHQMQTMKDEHANTVPIPQPLGATPPAPEAAPLPEPALDALDALPVLEPEVEKRKPGRPKGS